MTTPVSGPGDGTDGPSIRPAERADLLAVVRIENESFAQPWPYDAFERFLDEPGFLVAVRGDREVAGYIVADVAQTFGRQLGHIKDIAVHPDHRGTGIGSALLSRAIAVLTARGADSVKLEVRRSNEGAKRLYRKFGFEPLRRVPNYYENDEDAIVMLRKLQ
ncbi:ribosomal protein S18-alanine N-acetyltransferase [Natronorubrum sp. JWXQ-INN-674]|uniref:Ribosomal protein S18-alanine N-acetyltransferase n=1 Tax=Natronorubrum halalkaliphilum TaxID=2691917 RepID=A0A6B0VHT6_9EURY|nr:ribosomal protein S18-alanine N-acetyltransferase [Natronorubrum halalkaliphilum]MXV61421.1 ribosomal protein S18-alanine N-acetyltransferase [Natronorubrum halalkaliphilum]